MRIYSSLAGSWQFQLDPTGTLTVGDLAPDRTIPVPLPWQAAFPELERYSGYGWYRRSVELTEKELSGEVLLRFGAVDYWCQVFVNGRMAGEHEGGHSSFTIPISGYLRPGANELAVRVYDSVQTSLELTRWPPSPRSDQHGPPFAANDIPHGKQEWYLNASGIWQDVVLITTPKSYIELVHVIPSLDGRAAIHVTLSGDLGFAGGGTLRCTIRDREGRSWQTEQPLQAGQARNQIHLQIDPVALWSPADPALYNLDIVLETGHGVDTLATRFGFREITARDGRILLNGEPIFLLAALDQDLYPETIYTVPSEEYLRDQFEKARQLGLNTLRCHIKPPDPRYLELADEMGLLVWAEIPSWRTFHLKLTTLSEQIELDEAIKRRVEQTLEEMIRRDFNHPALIIWTIVNEDWGTSLPLSAADRQWVGQMYDRCKALDPTRLVVDNSACPHPWGPNIHVKSDLDDFHLYANIPDQAHGFVHALEQFNLRPIWTFSSHGDAQRTGQEPLVLSEFGNWGMPSLQGLLTNAGEEPAWFKLGPWWSGWDGEPGWPMGVAERFKCLGLDRIWGDYERFAIATQWHQYAAMKFEIETLRRQPALAGYVITELTDIYWESNGLLDFHRRPKAYHDHFAQFNAPDVIIPEVQRYAYWDDEPVPVCLHGSRYSAADWSGVRVTWSGPADVREEHKAIPALARGQVQVLRTAELQLRQVEESCYVSFEITLENGAGTCLARNQLDLLVLPASARRAAYQGLITVITREDTHTLNFVRREAPDQGALDGDDAYGELRTGVSKTQRATSTHSLSWRLQQLGYQVARSLTDQTRLVVTTFPTAELLAWVRGGGDMLFLSSGPSPFFWVQGRSGIYSGSWITSFSWLRPGIYRRLQTPNPLGLPFMNSMPHNTILGLPVEDPRYHDDLLAGMIAGWVRHPAIHTVQFRYGHGRVIMTTFALEQALGQDPVATAMLHDLIDHLASDACRPRLAANF